MTEFGLLFIQQLIATSATEWVAVIFALVYLLLAIKENVWCWPAAFFSTAIYIFLFFDVNLYMESLLNFYYLLMAIYGWYQWVYKTQGQQLKPISRWSIKRNLGVIFVATLLSLVSGYLLDNYTNQDFAYIDSLTTWFAIIATYMVTQKILENWLYWIVIDMVSIYLYLQKGFALTTVLFVSYLLLAVIGWLQWRRHFIETQKQAIQRNPAQGDGSQSAAEMASAPSLSESRQASQSVSTIGQ